jgi:hypothetical protein
MRIPYPEEMRMSSRFSAFEDRFPPEEPRPAFRSDASFDDSSAEPRRKSRWSISKILLGYCPEFAASFAN